MKKSREDRKAKKLAKAEGHKKEDKHSKKYRIGYTMLAKIFLFFMLLLIALIGVGAATLCTYMNSRGYYEKSLDEVLEDTVYDECIVLANRYTGFIAANNPAAIALECERQNIEIEIMDYGAAEGTDAVMWRSGEIYATGIIIDHNIAFSRFELRGYEDISMKIPIEPHTWYLMRIYVDPNFTQQDSLRELAYPVMQLYKYSNYMLLIAAASILPFVFCLVALVSVMGHRNGYDGIVAGPLSHHPFEVVVVEYGVCLGLIYILYRGMSTFLESSQDSYKHILILIFGVILFVWIYVYFMEIVIRIKLGGFWKNTLFYMLADKIYYLMRGLPLVFVTCVGCLMIVGVEWLVFKEVSLSKEGWIFWTVEKLILLPFVLYIAVNCKALMKAGKALAEGRENYRVDTSKMFGEMKVHGESLNNISNGISVAVEERMKSEHLRTELITNVSHDIKTPLTSIINYAGLICEEKTDNPKVEEYAEVLLRQSKRLKKLLEDLVEASKATTGNLEVNPVPCEVGVLLTQAVVEYEQRLADKELEIIVRQPEEEVRIMADGRHMWRVFDNLLSNICKYAQEGSRVYLSVEVEKNGEEEFAVIIFKNMSKYALDITPEELEERFVRGDKSRNIEGNGLGLSIAKSLMELQKGKMKIITDGDLFKVILKFAALKE